MKHFVFMPEASTSAVALLIVSGDGASLHRVHTYTKVVRCYPSGRRLRRAPPRADISRILGHHSRRKLYLLNIHKTLKNNEISYPNINLSNYRNKSISSRLSSSTAHPAAMHVFIDKTNEPLISICFYMVSVCLPSTWGENSLTTRQYNPHIPPLGHCSVVYAFSCLTSGHVNTENQNQNKTKNQKPKPYRRGRSRGCLAPGRIQRVGFIVRPSMCRQVNAAGGKRAGSADTVCWATQGREHTQRRPYTRSEPPLWWLSGRTLET